MLTRRGMQPPRYMKGPTLVVAVVALTWAVASAALFTSVQAVSAASCGGTPCFGQGDAAWNAYYNAPSDTSTWMGFCAGGGGAVVVSGLGVPACGPTGSTNIEIPGGNYTPGFQCVELSDRFLFVTRGWTSLPGNGAQVAKVYANAHGVPLIANGTHGVAPHVGDVMSFANTSDFSDLGGHTGVVTASSIDANGNGTITLLSENIGLPTGTGNSSSFQVSNWTVAQVFGFVYSEWVQSGQQLNHDRIGGGLVRYVNGNSYHFATTGQVDSSYTFEINLGFLAVTALPGTQALYSCHNGLDQFVSSDSGCEGATRLPPVPMGFAFNSAPAGVPSQAIYRCHGGADHFVTTDPNCEGAGTKEGLLGYTIAETSLNRYVNSGSYHFVTTGQVDASYSFESDLGFLALAQLPGTQALYSCHNGLDQFVSSDPNCEGAQRLPPAPMGFVFNSPPSSLPSQAIYRCHGGADHYVTTDPNCEGAGTNEGLLGYTIAETSLSRYVNPNSYHFVTTGQVDSAYSIESNLGFLALTALPGTQALYSCHNGLDQFVSHDSGCEGATRLPPAPMGFTFNAAPTGVPSQAIFRCHGGADHFVTTNSNCEGAGTNEGLLGYTITEPGAALPTNPGAPSGVSATPGNAQATIAWSSPSSDGGSPITSYSVTGSPSGSATLSCPCPTLQVVVTGLNNGTSYTFTVTANNAVGAGPASAPSNSVTPESGPTVTSVAPNTGPGAGGTSVTITGTSFTGVTSVKFGTTAAVFTFNSATQITATSPGGSGAVDVTVTTPAGTSATTSADTFTYSGPLCTTPTLSTGVATSPYVSGSGAITLTATGFCAGGTQFGFLYKDTAGTFHVIGSGYGSSKTATWHADYKAGAYTLAVALRPVGSSASYVTFTTIPFVLTGCGVPGLTALPASPQPAATSVTWTAAVTCSGTPQYEFYVKSPGGTWSLAQSYGSSKTFIWTSHPTTGTYTVAVLVRNAGAAEDAYDNLKMVPYTLT